MNAETKEQSKKLVDTHFTNKPGKCLDITEAMFTPSLLVHKSGLWADIQRDNTLLVDTGNGLCHYDVRFIFISQSNVDVFES